MVQCLHGHILECTGCPLRKCTICGRYLYDSCELFWFKGNPARISYMECFDHAGVVWRHPFSGRTEEEELAYAEELWAKTSEGGG